MKDWRCLSWMIVIMVFLANSAFASLVDNGLFSTIDQSGNPSHSLSFLDMSFSDGKTLADALVDAQAVFPDARAATPSEFDDLFASVDTVYLGSYRPRDAFDKGLYYNISEDQTAITTIIDLLGPTGSHDDSRALKVFTDPDGVYSSLTTRDMLGLYSRPEHDNYFVCISQDENTAPDSAYGWFLVSESAANVIPAPSAILLSSIGLGFVGWLRRRRTL